MNTLAPTDSNREPRRDENKPIDPMVEEAYWRDNFQGRTYVEPGASFDDYGPAYAFGVTSFGRYTQRRFEELETDLSNAWMTDRGTSSLNWDEARQAARDAWIRLGGPA